MSDTTIGTDPNGQQATQTGEPTLAEAQQQGDPAEPADLGDAGKKAIAAERDARKAAEKQAAEFRAQLDKIEQANLSELEKAQQRAEAAEKALEAKESEALRLTIAAKHGLTGDAAELLYGNTPEELESRAARIAALTKVPGGPVIPGQGTVPTTRGDASAVADRAFANFLTGHAG